MGTDDCKSILIGESFLLSKSVQELHPATFWVYLFMAAESGESTRFTLSKKEAEKYGIPRNTLGRAVRELREKGFIRYRSGKSTGEKNQYEFDYSWKKIKEEAI